MSTLIKTVFKLLVNILLDSNNLEAVI